MAIAKLEDELGDVIAKARVGQGCTVDQVAAMTGLSAHDIQGIESYRLRPSPEEVARLAEALSLDPRKLADLASDGWTPPPMGLPRNGMLVETAGVPYGGYTENCYILGCTETCAGAVVDPGGSADAIATRLEELGLSLELILITHAHADHIGGLRELVADSPKGIRLANHQLERDSVMRGLAAQWEPAKDGLPIQLGSLSITPLFTPGHTPGSTCYHAENVCFVGDTLFAGSIGRPADRQVFQQMLSDIQNKVLSLPEDTIILPGHGPATTVAEENAHNPFFI